jgi:hypothetical protein
MGLIGAVIALSIGPAIDRMGAKRMMLLAAALLCVHALLIAQTQHLWQNSLYVRAMLSNLGDDAARRDGFRPCSGNGYLQERQLGDAIRDLHVGRKLRAFGGIENLRHGCRRIELRPVLHDAQRPVRRIDHRDPALQAPSFR